MNNQMHNQWIPIIRMNFLTLLFMLLVSGVRAQVPAGYYDGTEGLYGDNLKAALHNIIKDHVEFSYDDLRDFILAATDEDPQNSNNVILLYTGRSQAKSTFGGGVNDWNREHVWAKSHGDFGTDPPAGTDAHHLRPTDVSVNSTRGNLDFDMGGNPIAEAPGCYYDSDSFEPRDAVKGDVARMLFYMAVRYEGENGEPDLEVVDHVNTYPNPEHGKLSVLMQWNNQDPPDDFEMNRNDVIYYQFQENRNPFIDHPEWVDAIWGDPQGLNNEMASNIAVYPNPVCSEINIEGAPDGAYYTLMSTDGWVVRKGDMTDGLTIVPVERLASGMYILLVNNHSGAPVKQMKVIKN